MARHVVFLVHGIGTYADNWANEYIAQLKTLWTSFPKLQAKFPVEDSVQFVPIKYDSVFELWRTRLGASDEAVIEHIAGLPGGLPADRLTKLTSTLTGRTFGATHLLDLALFHASELFKVNVLAEVDAQIWNAIPAVDDIQTFSVIAHSMGTAVIQQALQARADLQRDAGLWPPRFRVRTLLMVANISRLLELGGHADVYQTIVRPAKHPSEGVCDSYLNARNTLDPTWRPKSFEPAGKWIWATDPNVRRFRHLEFTHLVSRNPHELGDYLAHPLVHGMFFRSITSRNVISEQEIANRSKEHESKLPQNLFPLLAELADLEFQNNLESLLGLIKQLDLLIGP